MVDTGGVRSSERILAFAAEPTEGDLVEVLVDLLGREWSDGMLGASPMRRGPETIRSPHPLCDYLARYRPARDRGDVGAEFPYYREVASHVLGVRHLPGFERLLPELRNPEAYLDAVAEAVLANYFYREGYPTCFQIADGRTRRSDLLVEIDGREVHAECKRVRDYNSDAARAKRLYPDAVTRIEKVLSGREEIVSTFVRFHVQPSVALIDRIIAELGSVAVAPFWQIAVQTDEYDLWTRADRKGLQGGEMILPPLMPSWSATMSKIADREVQEVRLIAFDLDVPPVKQGPLRNHLKSALDQLPFGGPGLLGIQIPPPRSDAELEQYVEVVERMYRSGKGLRSNAVYLFWFVETWAIGDARLGYPLRPSTTTIGHRIVAGRPKVAVRVP